VSMKKQWLGPVLRTSHAWAGMGLHSCDVLVGRFPLQAAAPAARRRGGARGAGAAPSAQPSTYKQPICWTWT
jgi:hypothetical protein